jgi:endonuclease/exonuclease/phosphatase family metal-dependent hydrolase
MRLLTYNIHKGIGGRDRRYDLERIVRVIEDQKADLICLQEVTSNARRTEHDDQPKLLASYLKAHASDFQMNVHYRRGGYGNLVLSRWPIHTADQISLRRSWWKPRGAQILVVDTPEGKLHLANSHLGLRERERHWQIDRLLQHDAFQKSAHLPSLVVGDFNDWRDTLASGPFARHRFDHATNPTKKFRSFPAFMSLLSLDKAFHRGPISIRDAWIDRSWLARRASDHLPLTIDFRLTAKH